MPYHLAFLSLSGFPTYFPMLQMCFLFVCFSELHLAFSNWAFPSGNSHLWTKITVSLIYLFIYFVCFISVSSLL